MNKKFQEREEMLRQELFELKQAATESPSQQYEENRLPLETELTNTKDALTQSEELRLQLQNELTKTKDALTQNEELRRTSEVRLAKSEEERQSLQSECDQIQSELSEKERTLQAAESKLKEFQFDLREKAAIQQTLEVELKRLHNNELTHNIQTEKEDETKIELEALRRDKARANAAVKKLQEKNEQIAKERDEHLSQAEARISELEKELAEAHEIQKKQNQQQITSASEQDTIEALRREHAEALTKAQERARRALANSEERSAKALALADKIAKERDYLENQLSSVSMTEEKNTESTDTNRSGPLSQMIEDQLRSELEREREARLAAELRLTETLQSGGSTQDTLRRGRQRRSVSTEAANDLEAPSHEDPESINDIDDNHKQDKPGLQVAWATVGRTCPWALEIIGTRPPNKVSIRTILIAVYLAYIQLDFIILRLTCCSCRPHHIAPELRELPIMSSSS